MQTYWDEDSVLWDACSGLSAACSGHWDAYSGMPVQAYVMASHAYGTQRFIFHLRRPKHLIHFPPNSVCLFYQEETLYFIHKYESVFNLQDVYLYLPVRRSLDKNTH